MRESKYEPLLSRIPFDPREERVIDSVARWMAVLGRFQVLAGALIFVSIVGVAFVYGMTDAMPEAAQEASDTTPPLVSFGEITMQVVLAVGVGAALVGGIVLWGGLLLVDAAEDFERVVHTDEFDQHYLENALRRLRGYYRMEFLLCAMLLSLAIARALPEIGL